LLGNAPRSVYLKFGGRRNSKPKDLPEALLRALLPPVACTLFLSCSHSGHMAETDPMPDPETPEWPIAWAAKEVLRRHLGPKFDRRLPQWIAAAIVERMRLTRWLIVKRPPDPPHSTPGE